MTPTVDDTFKLIGVITCGIGAGWVLASEGI